MRDERGQYADLWAIGLLRHAVLAVGARLEARGVLSDAELALDASSQELRDLLNGKHAVTEATLQRRAAYRRTHTVRDAPAMIGEQMVGPLDFSYLSPAVQRAQSAVGMFFQFAVDHPQDHAKEVTTSLGGAGASAGIARGLARVIEHDEELQHVQHGEILVVMQATTALDPVFGIIAGAVSEYGGLLSHPAILAREHGCPAVVACAGAMDRIETGMPLEIDGTTGEVKILDYER